MKLTAENFSSANFWRNWEGYDYIARPVPTASVDDWHPAFGTLSDATRSLVKATFTPAEIQRMAFITYLVRKHDINEG